MIKTSNPLPMGSQPPQDYGRGPNKKQDLLDLDLGTSAEKEAGDPFGVFAAAMLGGKHLA